MEYNAFFSLLLFLIINPWEASPITSVRNFRRHTGPLPFTDWELGLRESVHQALLREHHTDPTLRDQILNAPFIGRQDTASPFGDIAVLARGQLYITSDGFKFLQDSDQDCVDCHDPRCVRSVQCQLWKSLGHHHKLLALWTVKRIRHRDPHYGHVFEIEYTISPITSAVNEGIIRRQGYFNYNIPGHIFVIRSDPRLTPAYYLNSNADNKWYKKPQQNQNQDYGEHGHFKPGILIGVSPEGYKHILHSFPGFYSSYHDDHTTVDPKEYELYKKLIDSLASKTSHGPHRFSPTEKTASTAPYFTTFVPVLQTTLQFENTIPPTTTHVVSPTYTQVTKYPEQRTTTKPKPITTVHYYAPVEITESTTATTPSKVIPTTATTKKPSSSEEIFTFDIFTATPLKKTQKTTLALTDEELDLFSVKSSTEPMHPVTESSRKLSPDSINEQLPPPEENVDTTVPYVSSTVTQPTTTTKPITTQRLYPVTKPITTQRLTPEGTTAVEKIPYTVEKTTVVLPIPTEPKRTTALGRSSPKRGKNTIFDKIYTVRSTIPTIITSSGTTLRQIIPTRTTLRKIIPTSTTLRKIVPSQIYTVTAAVPKAETTTHEGTTLETVPAKIYTVTTRIPTSTQKGTTVVETLPAKIYTLPATTEHGTTFTTFEKGTTRGVTIYTVPIKTTEQGTTLTERIPTTTIFEKETTPTFTPTTPTTTYTKPTTIFQYSFDSTTQGRSETLQSTINTLPATTTTHLQSTEPFKLTIPTTTSHYYYTFDTDVPKSSTTSEGTTGTTYSVKEETSVEEEVSPSQTTTKIIEREKVPPISSTTDNFLTDVENDKINKIIKLKKDFDEDDIFGEPVPKSSTQLPETTTKPVTQSDIANALFGNRRVKRIKVSSKLTRKPSVNTTRIIYGNFYSPSTETPSTTSYKETTFESTEIKPSTDQSLSTSISFEVNRRNKTKETRVVPTIEADVKTDNTKKVFDDFALKLVNHVRSIDYLQDKSKRQPKYKRRSFTRRKITKNNNDKKTE